jgi:transcription-repair coupling factor (superfamily II helicase)
MQLVAEAVADAKGVVVPDVATVNLDVPGEAHLPKDYVEADDARLEAYRRLASVSTTAELDDLRVEWLDRYGSLPSAAEGLLQLGALRLACLELGIETIKVLPAKVGVRSRPVVKVSPLDLTLSQQMRLRRQHGSRAYTEDTKELHVELAVGGASPLEVLALLHETIELSSSE